MLAIIIAAIFALDQLSKFAANKFFILNQPLGVIKGVFYLTLVHNRGAAFGLLQECTWFFIATAAVAVICIVFKLRKEKPPGLNNFALGLILAGALGNLTDRLVFGYVIDFLDFRVWPVFNLADSAITVGAVLLGWSILRGHGKG
jgi:signal peptidase II